MKSHLFLEYKQGKKGGVNRTRVIGLLNMNMANMVGFSAGNGYGGMTATWKRIQHWMDLKCTDRREPHDAAITHAVATIKANWATIKANLKTVRLHDSYICRECVSAYLF